MATSAKAPFLDLPTLALWLATFTGAIVATHLLRNAQFPLGWNYLALFLLAGVSSTLGRGIYRWMVAAWGGAVLMLILGARQSGYLATAPELLAMQYLPAALTGAMLGEWLRYQLSRWRGIPFSPIPSTHTLVVMAALLVILPLTAFIYAADLALAGRDPIAVSDVLTRQYAVPLSVTAHLPPYARDWIRTEAEATPYDRGAASLVMVLSILLIILAITAKFLFGIIEVAPITTCRYGAVCRN